MCSNLFRLYEKNEGGVRFSSVDKYRRARKQKHKKHPFADASASHLSLVLRHV